MRGKPAAYFLWLLNVGLDGCFGKTGETIFVYFSPMIYSSNDGEVMALVFTGGNEGIQGNNSELLSLLDNLWMIYLIK